MSNSATEFISHIYCKRKYLRGEVLILHRERNRLKGNRNNNNQYLLLTRKMVILQKEINQLCRSLNKPRINNYHFPNT